MDVKGAGFGSGRRKISNINSNKQVDYESVIGKGTDLSAMEVTDKEDYDEKTEKYKSSYENILIELSNLIIERTPIIPIYKDKPTSKAKGEEDVKTYEPRKVVGYKLSNKFKIEKEVVETDEDGNEKGDPEKKTYNILYGPASPDEIFPYISDEDYEKLEEEEKEKYKYRPKDGQLYFQIMG